MTHIDVGILGAGHMGQTHAAILKADKRVRVVGVADSVPAKAQTLAGELGARAFSTLDELLAAGVQAVYVTTPNTRHAPAVVAALERGVHVFSEKPMATSLADAAEVLRAARASRAVYQVGHNRRFAPVYRYLKAQIEQGFRPFLTHAKQNDGDWLQPPWITDLTLTGGFLYESTVHLLDMLRWLLGDAVAVQARARANVYDVLNDFAILLAFAGDRTAVLTSSAHASWAYPFEEIEIVGEHALLRSEELTRVLHSPGLEQEMLIRDYTHLSQANRWGYREEDRLFISACLGENASAVDAEEAYRSIELCHACYESAANDGAEVRLPVVR